MIYVVIHRMIAIYRLSKSGAGQRQTQEQSGFQAQARKSDVHQVVNEK